MSEVKRYRFKGAAGEYVYANDYDAAQSELAARREELAEANDELDTNIHNNIDLTLRLAAAEQRNVVLLELLRDIYNQNELSGFDEQRILEAIKPTESGASE